MYTKHIKLETNYNAHLFLPDIGLLQIIHENSTLRKRQNKLNGLKPLGWHTVAQCL